MVEEWAWPLALISSAVIGPAGFQLELLVLYQLISHYPALSHLPLPVPPLQMLSAAT